METDKLKEETKKLVNGILEEEINTSNLDHLDKLVSIYKNSLKIECMEGDENMNYGNYNTNYMNYDGRGPSRGSYGEYNRGYGEYNEGYNARGRDSKYRGYGHLDRMYNEYGNYSYGREKYGANEETDRSFHYMVKALEDFIMVLKEETNTPQQKQQLMEALQNSMR